MKLRFVKMSGAGNDFVMLDNRDGTLALDHESIAHLCDRHFGVGGDGVIAVERPETAASRYRMRYYNSDGGEAEMCGNGARCFARFARILDPGVGDEFAFDTIPGVVRARFSGDEVTIQLTAPTGLQLNRPLVLQGGDAVAHHCNTGVPHAVLFVPDAERFDVHHIGAEIRHHTDFEPRGTNVNFVQPTGPGSLRVRTYERGVEAETLACGTGVTASAIVAHLVLGTTLPVEVRVQGGDVLKVNFTRDGDVLRDVTLTGPADVVFSGEIEL
jgi:diaminopimelate epimerase